MIAMQVTTVLADRGYGAEAQAMRCITDSVIPRRGQDLGLTQGHRGVLGVALRASMSTWVQSRPRPPTHAEHRDIRVPRMPRHVRHYGHADSHGNPMAARFPMDRGWHNPNDFPLELFGVDQLSGSN